MKRGPRPVSRVDSGAAAKVLQQHVALPTREPECNSRWPLEVIAGAVRYGVSLPS